MIKDFLSAAFPWLVMGLCIAVLCAGLGRKKEDGKNRSYISEGMMIGLMIGVAMGTVGELGTGTSLSLGMLIGLTVGSLIPKKEKEE